MISRQTALATILAAGIASLGASAASADIIQAKFSSSYSKTMNITKDGWVHGPTSNVPTVTFNWTRMDSPGAGIDSTLDSHFVSYCVDLDQGVSSGVTNTYSVFKLSDSGYTAPQRTLLSRLWGMYQPIVNTADESAAFQLAVWELVYDGDLSMNDGIFKTNGASNAKNLAGDWLAHIASEEYAGPRASLVVLRSGSVQDQIAMVPAPGAAALLGLGGLAACRRRRRAA